MKYIKTFENDVVLPKYKLGDYVKIDIKKIQKNINRDYKEDAWHGFKQQRRLLYVINDDYDNNLVKIIGIDHLYEIEFPDGKEWYVSKVEIKRLLKPNEIEKYEIKKSQLKYNV